MDLLQKILVFTPTFDEAENIEKLVGDIFRIVPQVDLMVIDDNSPDGTGKILDRLAQTNPKLHVVHRPKKLGLGTAHRQAMEYAVNHHYDALITMDADFSHDPKHLPQMISLLKENDFVIGSRYIPGGGQNYGFIRRFISDTANALVRLLLSVKVRETTTSYRGFKKDLLVKILDARVLSTGYSFAFEIVYLVCGLTEKIAEFPIYFEDRRMGRSKISKREIFKAVVTLVRLFFRKVFRR